MENTGVKRVGGDYFGGEGKKFKTDLCENETFINYFSDTPSLQNIALVSTAIRLWMETEPLKRLLSPSTPRTNLLNVGDNTYQLLEDEVLKKITAIFLPDSLKLNLSNIIRPIGLQILKCIGDKDREYCSLNTLFGLGCSIFWTMEGIIDKVRSLKKLINDKLMDDQGQKDSYAGLYSLACDYCLEEYISILWTKISPERKSDFDFVYDSYEDHLVAYWTAALRNELPTLLQKFEQHDMDFIYDTNCSIFLNMVILSLTVGNVFALKYFWYKLTEYEKNINLKCWIINVLKRYYRIGFQMCNVRAEILCFLLSHVKNQTQLNEIFKTFSEKILKTWFCNWPFQKFFLPTITVMLPYLSEEIYASIMIDVTKKIEKGKTTHLLFRDIWSISPLKLKRSFLQRIRFCSRTILNFLNIQDIEMVLTMLKDSSEEVKKDIILRMVHDLCYSDNLILIDILVSKTLSNQDLYSFRKQVVDKSTYKVCFDWIHCYHRNNFEDAEKFLNWSLEAMYALQDFKIFIRASKLQNIFFEFNSMGIYIRLVMLGNYNRVDQFLTWYFETQEEIEAFKALVHKGYSYEIKNILTSISKDKEGWDIFEKFLNYILYSSSQEEITGFKTFCMKHIESLVFRQCKEFVSLFLNWCFNSDEEINRFKHQLFLSEAHIEAIFNSVVHEITNWRKLKESLMWYSPLSSGLICKLKSKLSPMLVDTDFCEKCNKGCFRKDGGRTLFHILDSLDTEESASECESACADGNYILDLLNTVPPDDADENTNETDSYDISDTEDICSVNTDVISMITNDWDTDSYCTDSDDDHSTSDYDEEVLILLTEILNTVEKDY